MKSIRFNLSALLRSLGVAVAGLACAFMLLTNVSPAYSLPNFFGSDKPADATNLTKGEDQLLSIEEGAQKTAIRQQDLLSGDEVIEKSNEGINEVQGAADANKMKRPSNSQGETIEDILQDKLENAAGK